MRYRHDTYTISGQTITLTGITTVTTADVRLIIDETAKKVICSSMQKSNISCSNNVITVPSAVAALDASHEYTIELDFGGDDAHNLAEFFGVTLLQGYEFMTDTEVTDELEDIMQTLDPELTAEQAASITAEAMQIINDDEEQS